ncbi:MAG: hypothetical protein HY360_00250, partial [Verrucomicrobia bacterium]|nr:hypothetical protein [Verrucomicrobiota bacterium]
MNVRPIVPASIALAFLLLSPLDPVSAAGELESILGSPSTEWQIGRTRGNINDYTIVNVDHRPVLSAGRNGIVLTSFAKADVDREIVIRFRLSPSEGKPAALIFQGGLKNPPSDPKNLFRLGLNAAAGVDSQSVTCSGIASGAYSIKSLPKNRLTWPESVRQKIEGDYAATASLSKQWLTLRCVIQKSAAQVYLDDRLLQDLRGGDIDPQGGFRLTLSGEAHLASVRVRELPPEDPRYEPIQIGGYLNTSRIKGEPIQRDSLPAPGKSFAMQGVPFIFPSTDDRGNDHIAVSPSWMSFGLLEGGFDGAVRWTGALSRETGRIQLRIPNGPYTRLHLLAASDGEPDTAPIFTAQFYRPRAGFPINFEARAPLLTAQSSGAIPVRLKNGAQGNLHLVTIPLEFESLAALSDLNALELELTKEVRVHRDYPDPIYYSQHGMGLPSGAHVYAITMERPAVEVDFQPDQYAHIWTAPEKPSYTATLKNRMQQKREVQLEWSTVSHDGSDKTSRKQTVVVPAGGQETVKLPMELHKYGYHEVRFQVRDEKGAHTEKRSLAYLHPDTRERGGWEEGRGPLFGFWNWGGAHRTPNGVPKLQVMVEAGAESVNSPLVAPQYSAEELAYAEAHGMVTHFLATQLGLKRFFMVDPSKTTAQTEAALIEKVSKSPTSTVTKLNKPDLAVFWAEPQIGPISYMSLPEYYGEPPYQMIEAEQVRYKKYHDESLVMARAIKKTWPQAKILLPWGLPLFPVAFLRNSPELTALMDGPALDVVLFERLPEMQLHQVTFSSQMWQLKQEWPKAGKPWPNFITIEGPCTSPAAPGALTPDQEADHTMRSFLVLAAYGTTRFLGWPTPFHCASGWGESHYGSGLIDRAPLLTPKVFYSAFATFTRQLNRMNYVKAIDTGSATMFCLQFKHYKTGELLHVFWTLRGSRPLTVAMSHGSRVTRHDTLVNVIVLKVKDGKVTFPINTS